MQKSASNHFIISIHTLKSSLLLKVLTYLLISLILLSGCISSGQDSGSEPANVQSQQINPSSSDINIATALYSNQRTPSNFYKEPEGDPNNFYTTTHIKNIQVMDPGLITPTTLTHEACTDSFDEALIWSEKISFSGIAYKDLVDNSDNNMLFEFIRVNVSTPNFITIHRIFKCDFINRENVDLLNPNENKGFYNKDPAHIDDVKLLVEYLWLFSDSNNYGYAITDTQSKETDSHYIYTLTEAHLMPQVTSDKECDIIDINELKYSINKSTRKIIFKKTAIKEILAQNKNGTIEICEES